MWAAPLNICRIFYRLHAPKRILYLWISVVWLLLWKCDPKSWSFPVISEVHKEEVNICSLFFFSGVGGWSKTHTCMLPFILVAAALSRLFSCRFYGSGSLRSSKARWLKFEELRGVQSNGAALWQLSGFVEKKMGKILLSETYYRNSREAK